MNIPLEEDLKLSSSYGIGFKMMKKMGMTAEHLERRPIEPDPNIGRAGLGFYSPSEMAISASNAHSEEGGEKSTDQGNIQNPGVLLNNAYKNKASSRSGSRSNSNYPKRRTYEEQGNQLFVSTQSVPSASLILAANSNRVTFLHKDELDLSESFNKVSISNDNKAEEMEPFDLTEVKYNIDIWAERCHQDLVENSIKSKSCKERFAELKRVEVDLNEKILKQFDAITQMKALKEALHFINNDSSKSNDEYIQDLLTVCINLKQNTNLWLHMEFYKFVAPSVVPLIKAKLASNHWNPLTHPFEPAELYLPWQKLLTDFPAEFELLMFDTYIPFLEKALGKWDGASPEAVITIFIGWNPQFSPGMKKYMQEMLLWPTFIRVIESWDPKMKYKKKSLNVTPSWLKMWEKLLGSNFRFAADVVGKRILDELENWRPLEQMWGKHVLVKTGWWRTMSSMKHYEITTKLIPKMKNVLQAMEFSYNNESVKPFNFVLSWERQFTKWTMCDILVASFFPNWHKFANTWMEKEDVDLEDIKQWYQFWRNAFPTSLLGLKDINYNFVLMLKSIESHIDTRNLVQAAGNLSLQDSSSAEKSRVAGPYWERKLETGKSMAKAKSAADEEATSRMEAVALKCEEKGIIFVPDGNNKLDGRQIYRCNGKSIYFAPSGVMVKQEDGRWRKETAVSVLNLEPDFRVYSYLYRD